MDIIEITHRNNEFIKQVIEEYSVHNLPIEVSFRKMLPEIKKPDRYTHLIHSYPAKLLVHIPYFFLNNNIFSKKGDIILDPFSGSGTVLLESLIAGRNAYGADSNPIARLITDVKVTKVDLGKTKEICILAISKAKKYKTASIPDVVNCNFWFPKKTTQQLSGLLKAIKEIEDINIQKFLLVSFSNCVKKVSYADPRVSVPVKLNQNRYKDGSKEQKKIQDRIKHLEDIDVYEKFLSVANENIARSEEFYKIKSNTISAKIISKDARRLTEEISSQYQLKDESIQMIITSPPYAGAQKYIRASSLNIGWTELAKAKELVQLDKQNIGRENYRKSDINISKTGIDDADRLIKTIFKIKPERANIVCKYLMEMKDALNEMIRVLKINGYLVLIVGNNKVCNLEFNTQQYLTEYLIEKGLVLQFKLIDDIRSYGLMTKRNKTADIISREWVLVFKKMR